MSSMVQITDLSKRFGAITAVDGISFDVDRGEVLGFLGPNGAGKSTTMKMVTGYLTPDSGKVTVDGEDIAQAPLAVKRRMGYLPEGAPLYGEMTPAALLDFLAEIRGFRGAEKRRRVEAAIEKVNLATVVNQPVDTLSKGFKRRVGIAQAILHDPEVLILDEPTDGLDPNQKQEVRGLIRDMAEDKVIILSTHLLEEVDAVCTRAVIIAAGRLVCDGTPADLAARSRLHNVVTMSVQGITEASGQAALERLPGVASVESLGAVDGATRLRVHPENGEAIVAAVSRAARDEGWEIEELHVERGRLDEVFRAVTTAESGIT